jgi:hypothetical protein
MMTSDHLRPVADEFNYIPQIVPSRLAICAAAGGAASLTPEVIGKQVTSQKKGRNPIECKIKLKEIKITFQIAIKG